MKQIDITITLNTHERRTPKCPANNPDRFSFFFFCRRRKRSPVAQHFLYVTVVNKRASQPKP